MNEELCKFKLSCMQNIFSFGVRNRKKTELKKIICRICFSSIRLLKENHYVVKLDFENELSTVFLLYCTCENEKEKQFNICNFIFLIVLFLFELKCNYCKLTVCQFFFFAY